jgi:hypothetical protein
MTSERAYLSEDGWLFNDIGELVSSKAGCEVIEKLGVAVSHAIKALIAARLPLYGQPLPDDSDGQRELVRAYANAIALRGGRIECVLPTVAWITSGQSNIKAFPDAAAFTECVLEMAGKMYRTHGVHVDASTVVLVRVPESLNASDSEAFALKTLSAKGLLPYKAALPDGSREAVQAAIENVRVKLGRFKSIE